MVRPYLSLSANLTAQSYNGFPASPSQIVELDVWEWAGSVVGFQMTAAFRFAETP